MKHIITFLISLLIAFFIILGLDREIARRDYLEALDSNGEIKSVEDCFFKFNCDYYNEMLKGE